MVWIYGGAYRAGASGTPGYDGTPLARHGVVLVTFNHRVGVEGYAYLPGVPANRALLDQVAALRWVRARPRRRRRSAGPGRRPRRRAHPRRIPAVHRRLRAPRERDRRAGQPGPGRAGLGRRTTRIFDDPPDVTGYPEEASLHLWDQHRFGALDLDTLTAR